MGDFEVVRAVSSREGCEGGRRITNCGCGWNGWTATDLEGTLATKPRVCTEVGLDPTGLEMRATAGMRAVSASVCLAVLVVVKLLFRTRTRWPRA